VLFGDGRADNPLAHLEALRLDERVRVADGVGDIEVVPALVDEVDGERGERGQPADELAGIRCSSSSRSSNRGHLPSEVEQRRQQLLVAGPRCGAGHRARPVCRRIGRG